MVHARRLFNAKQTHFSLCQPHVKVQALLNSQQVKGTYLEPINNSLQKPVEGLSTALLLELYIVSLYKGVIVFSEQLASASPSAS